MLEKNNFEIITASSGEEGIAMASKEKPDLVLMDVVMPKMGGKEAAKKMQLINPDLKIVFTSGYPETSIHLTFIVENDLAFLPKPFDTDTLRSRIRSVLDRTVGRSSSWTEHGRLRK